jgi:hypothetical protein
MPVVFGDPNRADARNVTVFHATRVEQQLATRGMRRRRVENSAGFIQASIGFEYRTEPVDTDIEVGFGRRFGLIVGRTH